MGLFNKIKNLFSDEDIVEETKELEIESKIAPPKLPTVMLDDIAEEKSKEEAKEEQQITSDRDLISTKTKFNFPVQFNEEDFEIKRSNRNMAIKQPGKPMEESPKPLYSKNEEKKQFRCTPIISPVYGILDKNYHQDELKEKDENNYEIPRNNKKVDFETIRNKAFGTLTDDIKENLLCEDCDLMKASKAQKQQEENLLFDISLDDNEKEEPEDDYHDFNISYEEPKEEQINYVNPTKIDINEVDIDISINNQKEKPKEENKLSDLELTDDLFNIIDSMNEEK